MLFPIIKTPMKLVNLYWCFRNNSLIEWLFKFVITKNQDCTRHIKLFWEWNAILIRWGAIQKLLYILRFKIIIASYDVEAALCRPMFLVLNEDVSKFV